jgi:hypothetical protein
MYSQMQSPPPARLWKGCPVVVCHCFASALELFISSASFSRMSTSSRETSTYDGIQALSGTCFLAAEIFLFLLPSLVGVLTAVVMNPGQPSSTTLLHWAITAMVGGPGPAVSHRGALMLLTLGVYRAMIKGLGAPCYSPGILRHVCHENIVCVPILVADMLLLGKDNEQVKPSHQKHARNEKEVGKYRPTPTPTPTHTTKVPGQPFTHPQGSFAMYLGFE